MSKSVPINADSMSSINELVFNSLCAVDHLVNNAGISSLSKFEDAIDVTNFKSLMVIVQ